MTSIDGVRPGTPDLLGATPQSDGVNFALFSLKAFILLFARTGPNPSKNLAFLGGSSTFAAKGGRLQAGFDDGPDAQVPHLHGGVEGAGHLPAQVHVHHGVVVLLRTF